ncbi:MAG: hypothetical protein UY54_C0007G0019 [Parcubacteria group bacterium GW2011_GWA2_50_10b]|nr:MAG: hypothetical protein UY54_C0007G0019 [Parcubacteria group bacterium GW2011_GWA2_50_10b]
MRVTVVLPTLDEGPLLTETVRAVFEKLQGHDLRVVIAASARLTTRETRTAIAELVARYGNKIELKNLRRAMTWRPPHAGGRGLRSTDTIR